ncbi:hypothetical protein Tco_1554010 [Tanacetum coccineum]
MSVAGEPAKRGRDGEIREERVRRRERARTEGEAKSEFEGRTRGHDSGSGHSEREAGTYRGRERRRHEGRREEKGESSRGVAHAGLLQRGDVGQRGYTMSPVSRQYASLLIPLSLYSLLFSSPALSSLGSSYYHSLLSLSPTPALSAALFCILSYSLLLALSLILFSSLLSLLALFSLCFSLLLPILLSALLSALTLCCSSLCSSSSSFLWLLSRSSYFSSHSALSLSYPSPCCSLFSAFYFSLPLSFLLFICSFSTLALSSIIISSFSLLLSCSPLLSPLLAYFLWPQPASLFSLSCLCLKGVCIERQLKQFLAFGLLLCLFGSSSPPFIMLEVCEFAKLAICLGRSGSGGGGKGLSIE